MLPRIVSAAITLLALVVAPLRHASAQDVTPLEPVVVTATKIETPQERLGASVTVITGDELQAQNQFRIEEALRSVPGVEVERQGVPGKATSISIRGANPNQVQILVDGMRVKSPTLGSFDFADLSLDAIDRIEIVRGPQSTLYGADAIGGVINIITKQASGPPSGTLGFESGTQQTFREHGSFQGALGRYRLSLSSSRFDTRGEQRTFDNDDSEQTAAAGRFGIDLPWGATLDVTARYAKLAIDVPVNAFLDTRDPDSQQQDEFQLATLVYRHPLTSWWTVSGRVGQMWHNQGFQNGPRPVTAFGPDFAFTSQFDTRRRELEILSTWQAAKVATVTLGLEHRKDDADARSTASPAFRAHLATRSIFLQNEVVPLPGLTLAGGARLEDSDTFASQWTPRASLAYLVAATGTKLRGGWGEGFRAPTINDLFFPSSDPFCPPFSNPRVEPERSTSWEVGVDQTAWERRVRATVTYFHNAFEHLITPVPATPTALGMLFGVTCQQQGNAGRAESKGVEGSLAIEPVDWLVLDANYTLTDAENLTTHEPLPRMPRHRWNAGVTVTPVPRVSFFVQSHVVTRQFDGPATNRHNPGYYRIDTGGTVTLLERSGILDRLDFTLRIQNLTDHRYSEVLGFPAPGFTALAGLRASFR